MRNFIYLLIMHSYCCNGQNNCWASISASTGHTLAIRTDGTLWAWGLNTNGEVGNFTCSTVGCFQQNQPNTDTNWLEVSAGGNFSLAKKTDGTLWTWGNNDYGQLGNSNNISYNIPIQIGNNTDWYKIRAGGGHVVAIKTDGTLWAWGANTSGQLGLGNNINKNFPAQVGISNDWVEISANSAFTAAIKSNGTLWSWGLNDKGQLGDGTLIDKSVPTQIGTDNNWLSISASYTNSLALKTDGSMWAWGYNNAGQVGNGTSNFTPVPTPTQVGTDTDWQKIATGRWSCYALKQNGKLYHFGSNVSGQGGNNSPNSPSAITSPIQVGTDTDWSNVYSNFEYAMATKTNGDLYSWGYNYGGQLAIGSFISQYSPVLVSTCNLATAQFANTTVTVYPNPTAATLTIANTTQPIIKLVVTDMLGKKILEQNGNATQINVSELQKGLYVLQVYSDGEVSNYKFVRE
jgi:alpha-tubulin suppressor-like RCC1 family protein